MKEKTSILVAADIHALDGASRFAEVLSLVARDKTAVQPKTVLLGGDYVGGGGPPGAHSDAEHARRWQPAFRLSALRKELTELFGPELRAYFTYGSHDKNEADGASGFFTGPADCGDYYLYGVSFCQMRYAADAQRVTSERPYDGIDADGPYGGSAEPAAAAFSAWAAALPDRKPVFVMSHMPLHAHRKDNLGAALWCAALNRAAERRSVFVFFAHNHTAERRTPLDRQYYLVPAGSTMPVQTADREVSRDMALGFTYLNAGYVLNGCCLLLTLSDEAGGDVYDTLTIRRYASDPADTAFGDTGFSSPYIVRL